MRASWESLHADLTRQIRTLCAAQAFARARERHTTLASFVEPAAIVSFLTCPDGDLDTKDCLLAIFVKMVQSDEARKLGSELLWLGLWPGLDAIYRRRLRHFSAVADELVSELADAFTREVAELNLASVSRVAATIVRSTERRLRDQCIRTWDLQARFTPLAADEDFPQAPAEMPSDSVLGMYRSRDFATDLERLWSWLVPVVGDDAALVLDVAVLGEPQLTAGARRGASHVVTRKRFQRALARIRKRLVESQLQSSCPTRVR